MTTVDKRPDRIAGMFDAIAPRYDLLNHLLSGGIDRRWRERAVQALELTGTEVLLDVCSGTADIALEARRSDGASRVVGVDFARSMLALGMRKVRQAGESNRIALVHGDAASLPVRTASIEAAAVAFGIRNVQDPHEVCGEIARVLKPGGRLAILEFGAPRLPGISTLYRWYFLYVLPLVGRIISGHTAAYSYLPASVSNFPPPAQFAALLQTCGFNDVRIAPLTLGIVYLYTARRAQVVRS